MNEPTMPIAMIQRTMITTMISHHSFANANNNQQVNNNCGAYSECMAITAHNTLIKNFISNVTNVTTVESSVVTNHSDKTCSFIKI